MRRQTTLGGFLLTSQKPGGSFVFLCALFLIFCSLFILLDAMEN